MSKDPSKLRGMRAQPPDFLALQRKSLGHVLFTCARLLDELAQAEVNREAGERVARPAVMRLLPHLAGEGIRATELARRVDVTKQAVGQSIAELEARGLVEQRPDPADKRARIVRLSPLGAFAMEHGLSVLASFEAALREELGAARVDSLFEGLNAMLGSLEQWTQEGPPAAVTSRRRTSRSRAATKLTTSVSQRAGVSKRRG